MKVTAFFPAFLGLLVLPCLPLSGANAEGITTNAAITRSYTQVVLAEGRAAIGPAETGGALAAKQAAVAVAMRNAVEKVLGVYVLANSLTRNYQLLKDEILTRSDGFVVLKEIVRTERQGDLVHVVIRAEVSTRPLAEKLKALGLTRAFRIFVQTPETIPATEISTALTDAGFPVVENRANADVIVRVAPRFTTTAETPLKTAVGPMTLHSVRASVTVTATRAETVESVATLTASDTAANISLETAQSESASGALETVSPRLTEALLTLPARVSEPVEIVVNGIDNVTDAAALAEAMTLSAPGVQKVTRRKYTEGRVVYEADVLTDANPLLARALESTPALKKYHLKVTQESRTRITAVVLR